MPVISLSSNVPLPGGTSSVKLFTGAVSLVLDLALIVNGLLFEGDRTQGAVRVLYSTSLSERGVLFCAHRKPRPKDPFDFQVG